MCYVIYIPKLMLYPNHTSDLIPCFLEAKIKEQNYSHPYMAFRASHTSAKKENKFISKFALREGYVYLLKYLHMEF